MAERPADFWTEAARHTDRLNHLLQRTIAQRRLVATQAPATGGLPRMQLTFRQGGPVLAPMRSRFGLLGLYVGQICEARPLDEGAPRLATVKYRYALHVGMDIDSEPVLRWELDLRPRDPGARWSRHHIQGPMPLDFGGQTVSLNDLHLPTGEVLLEEVIRFCIHDLEVAPLSDDWDVLLRDGGGYPGD